MSSGFVVVEGQGNRHSDGHSAGVAAEGVSLPCLCNNNSDNDEVDEVDFTTVKWDESYIRKAAFALAANVEHFIEVYGLSNVGFLTITFDRSVRDYRESQRRFNNFARRVLAELFGDRIKVLEPHKDGRPHYHLLVDCGDDIRTGFNWEHYEASRKHYNGGGKRADAPKGDLGRTVLLKSLHSMLNAAAPRYGVGRIELTPIKSVAEAVGKYVGGYISKGSMYRDERYKGSRWVSYSRGFSKAVKGRFSWMNEGREWRHKVAAWAASHGCASLDDVKAIFGDHWSYWHREAICAFEPASRPKEEVSIRPVPGLVDCPLAESPAPESSDEPKTGRVYRLSYRSDSKGVSKSPEDASARRLEYERSAERFTAIVDECRPTLIEECYPEFAAVLRKRGELPPRKRIW